MSGGVLRNPASVTAPPVGASCRDSPCDGVRSHQDMGAPREIQTGNVVAPNDGFTSVFLSDLRMASGRVPKENSRRLHVSWGHPAPTQMGKSCARIGDIPHVASQVVEEINDQRAACNKFANAPTLPDEGKRCTKRFNGTSETVFFSRTNLSRNR